MNPFDSGLRINLRSNPVGVQFGERLVQGSLAFGAPAKHDANVLGCPRETMRVDRMTADDYQRNTATEKMIRDRQRVRLKVHCVASA